VGGVDEGGAEVVVGKEREGEVGEEEEKGGEEAGRGG